MNNAASTNVASTTAASPAELRRPASANRATWFGLCLSLFSLIAISRLFHALAPQPGTALTLAREAAMFACSGLLLWIVRRPERLPLSSIGIGTSPLWKSLAWGVVMAAACVIPAALIAHFAGYAHSAASHNFDNLPVWLITLIVVRAGVVEEFFYRAYSIDRLSVSASVASPRPSSRSSSSPPPTGQAASSTPSWRFRSAPSSPPSISGGAIWSPTSSATSSSTSSPTSFPLFSPEVLAAFAEPLDLLLFDLHSPVLRTAQRGVVRGHWMARPKSLGRQPARIHARVHKVGFY